MRRCVTGLAVAAGMLGAGSAGAQSWTTFGDGSVGYTTPYEFTGGFFCGTYQYFVGATCSGGGPSLHLASDNGGTIDLAYSAPGPRVITATNTVQTVSEGTVTVTVGGTAPFIFPSSTQSYAPTWFTLAINLAGIGQQTYSFQTAPGATSRFAGCCGPNDYFIQSFAAPAPNPFTYSLLAYSTPGPGITIGPTSATIPLVSEVGIAPEPSSLALLGTGLLALAPVVRRRRRSDP